MASGSFDIASSNKYINADFNWSSTSNVAGNYSDFYYEIRASRTNTGYTTSGAGSGYTKIDNSPYNFSLTNAQKITYNSNTLLASGTVRIYHDADGSKKITVKVYSNQPTPGLTLGETSAVIKLDDIPRKATITSAPDFTDEDNPIVKYSNLAGSAVSELKLGIFDTAGSVAYIPYKAVNIKGSEFPFEFTDEERETLRRVCTGKTLKVRYYLRTKIGDTYYWDHSGDKTLTIANAEPVITDVSVADVLLESLNVTGDAEKVVKGFNEMEVSMVAETRKGATIKSYKITNGFTAIGAAMGSFLNAESGEFVFSVTDSRDYTVSQKVTLPLIEYIKLTCNMNERPPDAEGNLLFTVEGNAFSGSFGYIDNEVQVYLRYAENGGEFSSWEAVETVLGMNNRYTAEVTKSGLNYQSTYTFQAKAVDLLNETESPARSVKTIPAFCWNDSKIKFNVAAIFKDDILAIDEEGKQYSLKDRVNELNSKLIPQYVRASIGTRQTISAGALIPFDNFVNHSDCIECSNGIFTVTGDVSVIRISASIGGSNVALDRGYFNCLKNGATIYTSIAYGTHISAPFDFIIEVQNGDEISFRTYEAFIPCNGGISCYCCIEKLA